MYKQELLIILVFALVNCQSKKVEPLDNKNSPTLYLSKDEINDLGEMKVGDLLFLLEHNIPISPQSKQFKNILKQVKRSKQNKVILHDNMIIVELYGAEKDTNQRLKIMDVIYLFKDNKLIKGPVVKRNNIMK